MGMFKDLMNGIFRHAANAERPFDAAPPPSVPSGAVAPAVRRDSVTAPVDVEAILSKLASENKETLNWKVSIVDLMKLVGMDSGLSARRELAADLRYTGDPNDSAAMNMWLHKEVMKKLAENGGTIPAALLAH